MYHSFLIHSSADGHLGCFHVLAKKLEIELPYDPAIPLLGIHTEEIRIERHMCTPMFIAALFIIARTSFFKRRYKKLHCIANFSKRNIGRMNQKLKRLVLWRPWVEKGKKNCRIGLSRDGQGVTPS